MIDLTELLAEAQAHKAKKKEADKAKGRILTGNAQPQDVDILKDFDCYNWRAEANVLEFIKYSCDCGQHRTILSSLLLKKRHTKRGDLHYTAVDEIDPDLPLYRNTVQHIETAYCDDCVGDIPQEPRNE